MAHARNDDNEIIRLSPFALEGVDMIDIRFWRKGKLGPRPTKRGIVIKQKMLVPFIVAMQKVHAQVSSEAAQQKEAGVM